MINFIYKDHSWVVVTTDMVIFNKSRKTVLSKNYRLCRSSASKARGLMFTNESEVLRNALVFEFSRAMHQSMHMFFVFYSIDVIFLDDKKRVIDMKENFRPFTVYNSRSRSRFVIELPKDTVRHSKTRVGDEIIWQ